MSGSKAGSISEASQSAADQNGSSSLHPEEGQAPQSNKRTTRSQASKAAVQSGPHSHQSSEQQAPQRPMSSQEDAKHQPTLESNQHLNAPPTEAEDQGPAGLALLPQSIMNLTNTRVTRNLVQKLTGGVTAQPPAEEESTERVEAQSDQNYQFYKEYCRLYYANIILTNRLQQLLNEKQELQFKLNRLESNKRKHEEALGMTFDIAEEKRKRHRRTATEIARHYKCPVDECPKSYGSEGSLNQHIKLKHPEFYQQMSANNPNLPGMSKPDSTLNNDDGKSLNSDSYGGRGTISDDEDDESSDGDMGQRKALRGGRRQRPDDDEEDESFSVAGMQ